MNKKNLEVTKTAIKNSQTNGKIDPDKVKKQISQILKSKPAQTLKNLKQYKKLLIAKLIKEQIIISSALALDSDLQKQLEEFIKTNFENFLPNEYLVEPKLLGGLKIQIGDKVIDSTLAETLKELDQEDE